MERSIIIKELEQYYNQEGIIPFPGQFACKNLPKCSGDYARGMQCHIGYEYGTRLRVLVASLDCGNGGASSISKRTDDVTEDAKGDKRDRHMKGTFEALALFYDEKEPRNLVNYMAMTNTCKCCRLKGQKNSSNQMPVTCFRNCKDHTLAEILLLAPQVILFQGKNALVGCMDKLFPIEEVTDPDIKPYVKKFKYEGFECFAVPCIHPSACYGRNAKRWKEFYKGTEGNEAILSKVADYIKNQLNNNSSFD